VKSTKTPVLFAESPLNLSGFRKWIDGAWESKHVEHRLSTAGYKIRVEVDLVFVAI